VVRDLLNFVYLQFINWTLEKVGMNDTAWEYLIYHKFGIVSLLC